MREGDLILTVRKEGAPDRYEPIKESPLQAVVRVSEEGGKQSADIEIRAQEDFSGVIRIALRRDTAEDAAEHATLPAEPRFYLPGVLYGTNRGEAPLTTASKTPRLRQEKNFPASPWWMFRGDRLSHPCALLYAEGRVTGLAAAPYYVRGKDEITGWQPGAEGTFFQYAGFGCSLTERAVWYTLGYENAPWFFLDSHKTGEKPFTKENCFKLKKGECVTVHLSCFDIPGEDERCVHEVLRQVYEQFHESPRRARSIPDTVRDISEAILQDAWVPEHHCYTGFVFDKGDHFENRLLPSISWTNGLSAAVPMLRCAHRLQNEEMRAQALECIDHIVQNSINPQNDLPYLAEQDGVWSNRGWWYDIQNVPGHAAYLVGQSVYLILKAYAAEKALGTVHEDWMAFAERVIRRTEKSRNADGEYPYILSEKTGAGIEYDSMSGAWLMAAAAYYSHLTGEERYLEDMLRSEAWYYDTYVRHLECYAGPLDIAKNIDSEGILSYIRAVRYLHAILEKRGGDETVRERLLDHLRDALYYEYTFKFCYNSPVKVPPLSTVGWSSCGGSITSVTNPHIHPMSSSVMDEMYDYLSYREDPYIRSRLEDTILWSCQCHNTYDGEFGYGKKGWMSERFCHSEGLLTESYPDGSPASTWFALMPWACGSILEGLTGQAWDRAEAEHR